MGPKSTGTGIEQNKEKPALKTVEKKSVSMQTDFPWTVEAGAQEQPCFYCLGSGLVPEEGELRGLLCETLCITEMVTFIMLLCVSFCG